jgi:pimeloyl-ACP methyl ester carboxylesterase
MDHLLSSMSRKTSPSTGLSYLCSGSAKSPKKLFICFHGWACSATDYLPLNSALASDLDFTRDALLVALDFPGHGESPKSICPQPGVSGFAALANDLRRELSGAGTLLDTVLVGHSMGCRMTIETFLQLKTNVSAIILIDGSWVGRNPEVHAPPVLDDMEREIQRMSDRIGMYGPFTPQSFKDEMAKRLRKIDLEYEYELSREYIEWDRERTEDALDEIGNYDGARVLTIQSTQGRGASRRLLMKGEEGPFPQLVRDNVGNGKLTSATLQDCGHWPHIDKAGEVARILLNFEQCR